MAQPKLGLPDIGLGRADVPITVIEYSSLGCNHCADHHAEVMPRLKAVSASSA